MKNKKGFEREEVLIISRHQMSEEFELLLREDNARSDYNRYHEGYNKYSSEFDPRSREDYSKTFTKENLEDYWKGQIKSNNFEGSLQKFINDYGLELDVWFINCGYDFTGIRTIIIDY